MKTLLGKYLKLWNYIVISISLFFPLYGIGMGLYNSTFKWSFLLLFTLSPMIFLICMLLTFIVICSIKLYNS